jgi:serine/threonine protein kinase
VAYLAREPALGEPIDARTDLYAIGVTLYELVTGRLPFVGDDPVSVSHLVRTPAPRCAGVPGKDPRDFLPARCVLAAGPFRILTEREEAASVLKAVREDPYLMRESPNLHEGNTSAHSWL